MNRLISKGDVVEIYHGRPGCACGCRGSYLPSDHPDTEKFLKRLARSRNSEYLSGLDGGIVTLTTKRDVLTVYLRSGVTVSGYPQMSGA